MLLSSLKREIKIKYWKGIGLALLVAILVGVLALAVACTEPPVASLATDKTKVATGEPVQFTSKSTGEITSWSWDFGDGNTSTQQNPFHAYAEKGNYTATLTVSNKAGSHAKTVFITVLEPVEANFSVPETKVKLGSSIQFVDESSGDVDSWSWDFGDGSTSTEQSPSHTYKDAGTYTVSLTVSNAVSSDIREKKNYINIISFVVSRIEMCSNVIDSSNYTIQPDATFRVGDTTWVYFEVTGFDQQKTDGNYEFWLQWQELKFYGPDGNLMGALTNLYELHETTSVMAPGASFWFSFGEAERTDPLGEYTVKIKVEDKLSGETATESITFILE
jgi:PKD repeat protein